jgi:hypothetical protein
MRMSQKKMYITFLIREAPLLFYMGIAHLFRPHEKNDDLPSYIGFPGGTLRTNALGKGRDERMPHDHGWVMRLRADGCAAVAKNQGSGTG